MRGRVSAVPGTTSPLDRVILTFPSLLSLDTADKKNGKKPPRSWIQLAKTGSFVSSRYGKFSITPTDLREMKSNFDNITPKAPTRLPIDYDHLSMNPERPGDGVAAGWMLQLELREDDKELWAEVEWTPRAADAIKAREYQYTSPSFVKDHVHKDGKKIGTTLLAAAITNHPFLEGMKAVTLHNLSMMGEVALLRPVARHDLADVGQRVMIAPGNARTQDEIGGTFEIAEVIGEGDDAFVSVRDANGMVHKWFRANELLPASSTPANPASPALQPGQVPVVPSQLPNVPTQPVTQAMNPAQAAAAQAAQAAAAAAGAPAPGNLQAPGVVPPGAAAPGAGPNANAAPNAPGADAKPNPFAAQQDGSKKHGQEGAVGAVTVGGAKTGAAAKNTADDEDDPMKAALKKAVSGLFAASSTPLDEGMATMTFTLRNDKNQEIVVSLAQLEAAGIKVVPEGSTAVPNTELSSMRGQITSLSTTVDALKADNEAQAQAGRVLALNTELDRMTKAALISKVTRDALFAQFKDATDLTAFKALAATFTKPIIDLNREHGTAADNDVPSGEQASREILTLANSMVKEQGLSLSEAVKRAGAQLADRAETYRESFAEVH